MRIQRRHTAEVRRGAQESPCRFAVVSASRARFGGSKDSGLKTSVEYAYTRRGQLAGKYLGGKLKPDAAVEYEYAKNGQITARTANGVRQTYEYDFKGQLLGVREGEEYVERYAYDKAGNMVKKVIRGSRFVVRDGVETLVRDGEDKVTTFTFDDANQLVSFTTDGVTTRYEYDAAGRMTREGDRTYTYGYLDKVTSVRDGADTYTYTYHPDGQLATADYGNTGRARTPAAPQGEDSPSFETFTWDGLALIQRGSEQFINEPHIGGGNPVVSSKGTSYFNDMLGTTVGAKSGKTYSVATLSAFGEELNHHSSTSTSHFNSSSFFTGKPAVAGLGHAFLMRNYRAGLAKWQTADPMGYPDGWNQLKYGVNSPFSGVDLLGCWWEYEYRSIYFGQTFTDFCELPGGLPLEVGNVGLSFWQTVLNVFAGIGAEALVGYAKDVVLPLWKLYANEYHIHDPDQITCEAEMSRQGYGDWEFVSVGFFSGHPDATDYEDAIVINRFDVTWEIRIRKE